MKKEINGTIEQANRRLKMITQDGYPVQFAEVELRIDDSEGGLAVYSGKEFLGYAASIDTRAIWSVVDNTRAQVTALTGDSHYEDEMVESDEIETIETISDVMSEVDRVVCEANNKLAKITENGFPFSFEEVKMSAEHDSAGIYIKSGSTPVVSVARTGDPSLVLEEIKAGILEIVDATRVAVERRGGIRNDADALKAECENAERAVDALKAAGVDPSILNDGIDANAAKAIVDAAKKSVEKANKNPFAGLIKYRQYKLTVREHSRGLVILADGKECLVTRFPKVSSNKTVEKMVKFIEADVEALAASRRSYFERVRRDADRAERLRELAARIDAADAALSAVGLA